MVHECETEFQVFQVGDIINKRKNKFTVNNGVSDNLLCKIFVNVLWLFYY